MTDELIITNKFDGKCIICGEILSAGEQVLWKKGSGIRHTQWCDAEGIQEDRSALIIIDP